MGIRKKLEKLGEFIDSDEFGIIGSGIVIALMIVIVTLILYSIYGVH